MRNKRKMPHTRLVPKFLMGTHLYAKLHFAAFTRIIRSYAHCTVAMRKFNFKDKEV